MKNIFALPAHVRNSIGRRGIDVLSGDEVEIPGVFTPRDSFSELSFALMNADTKPKLADFFTRCGYEPMKKGRALVRWELRHITPTIWERWQTYRHALIESQNAPEYIKQADLSNWARHLVSLDYLSCSLEVGSEGHLQVSLGAEGPVSAIGLATRLHELCGLGVARCQSLSCRKFFPVPTGHGHALQYCPNRDTSGGYYRASTCREREKKRRAKERLQKQFLGWARQAQRKFMKLPKKKQFELKSSKFIAEETRKLSGGMFRYGANWVTANLYKGEKPL